MADAYGLDADKVRNIKITGNDYGNCASDGSNTLAINADGALKIDWTNCPISEDSIRGIAREEMQEEIRTRDIELNELRAQQENLSPIQILRKKVYSWLNS